MRSDEAEGVIVARVVRSPETQAFLDEVAEPLKDLVFEGTAATQVHSDLDSWLKQLAVSRETGVIEMDAPLLRKIGFLDEVNHIIHLISLHCFFGHGVSQEAAALFGSDPRTMRDALDGYSTRLMLYRQNLDQEHGVSVRSDRALREILLQEAEQDKPRVITLDELGLVRVVE